MAMTTLNLDDVEKALADAYGGGKRPAPAAEARARRAREKNLKNAHDGRRKRRVVGRTVQLNVTIPEELRDRLVLASRLHRMLIVELVEQALEPYLADLDRKAKGGKGA